MTRLMPTTKTRRYMASLFGINFELFFLQRSHGETFLNMLDIKYYTSMTLTKKAK